MYLACCAFVLGFVLASAFRSTLSVQEGHASTDDFSQEEGQLQELAGLSLLQISTKHGSSEVVHSHHQHGGEDAEVPVVHVVYAATMNSTGVNDAGLLASMYSLSKNMARPDRAVIHIIVPMHDWALAEELVERFECQWVSDVAVGARKLHPAVQLHEARPLPFAPGVNSHTTHLSGNEMTYARWFLPEYLPNVSRVIYLDTDTIINSDIREMYGLHFDSVLMLKQLDAQWSDQTTVGGHYSQMVDAIPKSARTANVVAAGVFVADLDRWRVQNFTSLLTGFAESVLARNVSLDDQMALSVVCAEGAALCSPTLPSRFHAEGPGYDYQCDSVPNDSVIVHFSGKHKPFVDVFEDTCGLLELYKSPRATCTKTSNPSAQLAKLAGL